MTGYFGSALTTKIITNNYVRSFLKSFNAKTKYLSFPKSPRLTAELTSHNKSSVFICEPLDKSSFTRPSLVCEHCLAKVLGLSYFLSHFEELQALSYSGTMSFGNVF